MKSILFIAIGFVFLFVPISAYSQTDDIIFDLNQITKWQSYLVIGLILEFVGFILMTFLWGKIPTQTEWETWREKHRSYFDDWYQMMMKQEAKIVYYMIRNVRNTTDDTEVVMRYQKVPPKFDNMWKLKTKFFPISFVLFGLVLQLVQIFVLPIP